LPVATAAVCPNETAPSPVMAPAAARHIANQIRLLIALSLLVKRWN